MKFVQSWDCALLFSPVCVRAEVCECASALMSEACLSVRLALVRSSNDKRTANGCPPVLCSQATSSVTRGLRGNHEAAGTGWCGIQSTLHGLNVVVQLTCADHTTFHEVHPDNDASVLLDRSSNKLRAKNLELNMEVTPIRRKQEASAIGLRVVT